MVCVYCGSRTAVNNSRLQQGNNHVWRRRACLSCNSTFTTIERAELAGTFMVSDSSSKRPKLIPFSRDSLFITIYESCKHRPHAVSEAASLTQTVINNLVTKRPDGIVTRAEIAQQAHSVLKRFDFAAATAYAAYHGVE